MTKRAEVKEVAKGIGGMKGLVAGGLTGVSETLVSYPPEFVKTQLQLDEKKGSQLYSGIFDCVKKTFKERGFTGFYRGVSVQLVGTVPKAAVRFGIFEAFRSFFAGDHGVMTVNQRILGGLTAGFTEAVVVTTPMETIKVKFINDIRLPQPRFKGLIHGVRLIVAEGGIKAAYQGVVPTILRQSSSQAIRFSTVEGLTSLYSGDSKIKPPILIMGVFGSLGGAFSVLFNTPIDVVKTRMQGLEASKYKGSLDCARRVWTEEGVRGFYRGTIVRLSRTCIEVACAFMFFDISLKVVNLFWP